MNTWIDDRDENHSTSTLSRTIRTYCASCFSNCPVAAHTIDGEFTKVTSDRQHEFYRPLCPKGIAAPELVSSIERLEYPLMRTNPKNADDPGWKRISWKEALDCISERMRNIKQNYGPEAFAFSQTNVSSPVWEITSFVRRLANLYGTPNHITTTHICNWHRDNGSALTFGKPGDHYSAGWPDFINSQCILIWGHNPKNTFNAFHHQIRQAQKSGSKTIVIDPRQTDIAKKADLWMQVKPGTDGALALGMIHLMMEENLFDQEFVAEWTNAPFLVRTDSGDLLRSADMNDSTDDPDGFYFIDSKTHKPVRFSPERPNDYSPDLDSEIVVALSNGKQIICKTVFSLFKERVSGYDAETVERITTVPANTLREAVRLLARNRPSCWYSFNGVEQNINATQTNRAICCLYALTGDFDKKGGNVVNSPLPPLHFPFGFEFLPKSQFPKNISLRSHPVGPAGTLLSVPPYQLAKSILQSDPYKIRGLISFGTNTIGANPESLYLADAYKNLEFYVHIDLFPNPTAEFADIVLPAASTWEIGRLGYPLLFQENKWVVQWRSPVAPPRGESKDDLWIIFELAKRLGFNNQFWNGDVDAAFEDMLKPTGLNLAKVKNAQGGIFIQGPVEYQKYLSKGFNSGSGKIELFSQVLQDIGQASIPEWRDPLSVFESAGLQLNDYPYLLINAKVREYCQTQHRSLPSLRKLKPSPTIEINRQHAEERGIHNGDLVILKTIKGEITLQAELSDRLAANVVCTQHGWWQSCQELGLTGHDVYSKTGSNVNLLLSNEFVDPISGSVHIRGFPCNIFPKT